MIHLSIYPFGTSIYIFFYFYFLYLYLLTFLLLVYIINYLVRVDTMVTVVDACNFLKDFNSRETLHNRPELLKELGESINNNNNNNGEQQEHTHSESISALLVEQVEFANVVILNKTDLVSEENLLQLERIITALNPNAKLVRTTYGKVQIEQILNTHLFDFNKVMDSSGK